MEDSPVTRLAIFLFLPLVGFWVASASSLGDGVAGTPVGYQQSGPSVRTVVQMCYYAQPGKEQEVLENRLHASAVLAASGVTRGRVMARIDSPRATRNADDPDVVWEGEFPDSASLQRYEQVADENPDYEPLKLVPSSRSGGGRCTLS